MGRGRLRPARGLTTNQERWSFALLFGTTFLVDVKRELARSRRGAAFAFLARHADEILHVSLITVAEVAEGFDPTREAACWDGLRRYVVLLPDQRTAWLVGQLSRQLRERGEPVGDHDLWIAATALQHGLPLVTRNRDHFGRIPGLAVLSY